MIKFIFSFIFTVLSLSAFSEIIEDQSQLTIETPGLAERKVRKLRLENGLEALLISDPETPESGAAMAVEVGSWNDPANRPGMAHFVEHLLFLGTEKYPQEQEYTRYLSEHGGSQNAFTMADRTVYMFSSDNEAFLGALDRFGQFFISPLFNPSGVDRECKAIHQEFCKDVPMDGWRIQFVKKALANPSHPCHIFDIGNLDTLADISQDELKEWYREHYSANLMHLVIYSSEDLDILEEQAKTIFSQVKNNERKKTPLAESLFSNDQAKLIAIAPIQDVQMLELSWELPRFYGQDLSLHTDKLISHVLGHEGEFSLLAQLKREGLAEKIAVSGEKQGLDQHVFILRVFLTSKGLKEYETVIERCFQTIASLKSSGIPRYIYDEVKNVEEISYRFQSRKSMFKLVAEYAAGLVDEPLETFPRQSLMPSSYSAEKVADFLEHLSAEKCHYFILANPKLTKITTTEKERWMGVEYAELPISQEKIATWSRAAAHPSICIPRPNHFIPEKLALGSRGEKEDPQLSIDKAEGRIFTCQDNQYLVPEVYWTFKLRTPKISDSNPKTQVLADLFCHTVEEQLQPIAYEAKLAGLSYSLKPCHDALELNIHGFSDKSVDFLESIITVLKNTCPSKADFLQYCNLYQRNYHNISSASPLKQGGEILWGILYKEYVGISDKIQNLQKINYEQMQSFCRNLFKEAYIEGMLFGNSDGNQVWDIFKTHLNPVPYPPERHSKVELATLSEQECPSYIAIQSSYPANAVILAADCGEFSFEREAAQEILAKGLNEPFFSELRTKQQTAYLLNNWSSEIERHLYSFFIIQSTSHDTRDLLSRFELFLEGSLQNMKTEVIPKSRFESIRSSLIYKLEHPAENLSKMGGLLHILAFDYDGDFKWYDKRIQALKELTYDQFLEYAHEFFGKNNPKRLAIFVNGAVPENSLVSYKEILTPRKLKEEVCYSAREK